MEHCTIDDNYLLQSQYDNLSDIEIVQLAQKSDQSASEYLLYKYRGLVRNKVRSYFLMGAEKEDLLQVGMIGLWQAIIDFRQDKDITFLSFARICIERHVITAIKTASRRKQAPLNSSISLEHSSDDCDNDWSLEEILACEQTIDPEAMFMRREDSNQLRGMLRKLLSDFEWQVLSGYRIGKSYREIAIELQCKTKAVDNALARIKKKISLAPHEWPGVTSIAE